MEFWSGFWSVMESDFEFCDPFGTGCLQRRSGVGSDFGGNQ